MKREHKPHGPPRWMMVLLLFAVPFWLGLKYWLNNGYSGWSAIAGRFPAGERRFDHGLGPVSVTVIQPSGRRFAFDSQSGSGRARRQTEVGVDGQGFWVRSRGGRFSGPAAPVYIPWDAVARCDGPSVRLRPPAFRLVIQDREFADACRRHVNGVRP